MSERFRDPGASWYGLLEEEILVRCPRCDGMAAVLPREGGPGRGLFAPRRLLCPACGHVRDWEGDRVGRYDDPEDPYFRLPLWLCSPCRGRTLWAYGRRHLDLLEEYVAARHRERPVPTDGSGHRVPRASAGARTLVEALPAWIKNAKHRDEILRAVARMRATLGAP
ncbi:hypothetical protein [Streptosporangium carneum]|uniref:TFIIB-type zinc ribbon-containing protein n=1 Tax=Streptosporangium carneum TaxID=47481 RepID=A0A9W6MBG8_9ACTN|nr:hypothetical protein [Streptosporangium carneum]GLK07663.1 hypothetical protein GCM10017600_10680 [Streptosporangium carneum]